MKKEGYVVALLAVIFLFTFSPTVSPPCGEYIRIDRSSYCIGDVIRITFYMPGTGSVTIWDHTTDGRTEEIFYREQEGKESSYISFMGVVEGPPGTETLEYEVYEGCWPKPCFGLAWDTESVSFSVKDCDPCKNIVCENGCYGCDYWAMECDDGDCVKDYIIERDSCECGSECCYSPTTVPPTTTPEPEPEEDEKIKVRVHVTDQVDDPVEGATIYVNSEKVKTGWFSHAKTDKNGISEFELDLSEYEGYTTLRFHAEKRKYRFLSPYNAKIDGLKKGTANIEVFLMRRFKLKIRVDYKGSFIKGSWELSIKPSTRFQQVLWNQDIGEWITYPGWFFHDPLYPETSELLIRIGYCSGSCSDVQIPIDLCAYARYDAIKIRVTVTDEGNAYSLRYEIEGD
jgi:hypothetical protein